MFSTFCHHSFISVIFSLCIVFNPRLRPITMSQAFFADVDVSGFPDDALTDHQKYEHPLVARWDSFACDKTIRLFRLHAFWQSKASLEHWCTWSALAYWMWGAMMSNNLINFDEQWRNHNHSKSIEHLPFTAKLLNVTTQNLSSICSPQCVSPIIW